MQSAVEETVPRSKLAETDLSSPSGLLSARNSATRRPSTKGSPLAAIAVIMFTALIAIWYMPMPCAPTERETMMV